MAEKQAAAVPGQRRRKNRVPVGPNWELCHKINEGSFGKVYKGVHAVHGSAVAVKVEPLDVRHPQLPMEAEIYLALRHVDGVPRLHWHGSIDDRFDAIVIDLLGPDLDTLLDYCGEFTLGTVLRIAVQLIDRLEGLHRVGYVYRDIKPQNFAIGAGEDGISKIYILDFGLAKQYSEKARKTARKKSGLVGTARYASISAHRGERFSKANDLESVGYMLMYWLRGRLPWSGLKARNSKEKYEKIMRKKLAVPLAELCTGHPPEMIDFIQYCRSCKLGEEPDYLYLRGLLKTMAENANINLDCNDFDWCSPSDNKYWPDPSLPDLGKGQSRHPITGTMPTAVKNADDKSKPRKEAADRNKDHSKKTKGAEGEQYVTARDSKNAGTRERSKSKICVII